MVNIVSRREKELYQCGECGLQYERRKIAEQCQAWCKEHMSCNLDLIQYAVKETGTAQQ